MASVAAPAGEAVPPGRVAAHVIAALNDAAADSASAEWNEKLFRMISGYVRPPSTSERGWPLDAWTEEKSGLDRRQRSVGSDTARAKIAADISRVLATAEQVAGNAWVFDNITGPLRKSADPQSLDDLDDAGAPPLAIASNEDSAVADLVRSEYASLCAKGVDASQAANEALAYGYGLDVPTKPSSTGSSEGPHSARRVGVAGSSVRYGYRGSWSAEANGGADRASARGRGTW